MQTLFHGITIAAASGLLLGAAFKPQVVEGGFVPPQLAMAPGVDRPDAPSEDFAFAARATGPAPAYVTGTAWMAKDAGPAPAPQRLAAAAPPAEPAPRPTPVRLAPARFAEPDPALTPVSFPSVDGDVTLAQLSSTD